MACGHPERIEPRLRSAARMKESFYGLIAQAALGIADESGASMKLTANDWASIGAIANVRRATALAEIGETGLAEEMLRHQAKIGLSRDHESLIHLAARLDLPAAQIWLAQNGPSGAQLSAAARYPMPAWTPASGWQVDKALVFAHALQESRFKTDAVSSAGARGVMQLMPATAQMVARHLGRTVDPASLFQPATSIDLGQAYLRELADNSGTGGLLPKVIAAYNAGLGRQLERARPQPRRPAAVHRIDPLRRDPRLCRGRAAQLLDVPAAQRRQGRQPDRDLAGPVAALPRHARPRRRPPDRAGRDGGGGLIPEPPLAP
jgi:soluble lytic murein transglycosylase-like protein